MTTKIKVKLKSKSEEKALAKAIEESPVVPVAPKIENTLEQKIDALTEIAKEILKKLSNAEAKNDLSFLSKFK